MSRKRKSLSGSSAPPEYWLAKVPIWVLDEWDAIADSVAPSETPVAVLDYISPAGTTAPQKMALSSYSQTPGFPCEATLSIREEYIDASLEKDAVYIATHDPEEEHAEVVAPVSLVVDVQPKRTDLYREFIKKDMAANMAKNNKITIVPDARQSAGVYEPRRISMMTKGSLAASTVDSSRSDERYREHRARLPIEELRPMIFRLFESQEYWRFADLVVATDQPTAYLKEVIEELCDVPVKSGAFRNMYKLKLDYRTFSTN